MHENWYNSKRRFRNEILLYFVTIWRYNEGRENWTYSLNHGVVFRLSRICKTWTVWSYKYSLASFLTRSRVYSKKASRNLLIRRRGTNIETWRNIKWMWYRPATRFVFIARLAITSNFYLYWLLQFEKFRPISSVNQNWPEPDKSKSMRTHECNMLMFFWNTFQSKHNEPLMVII